jgi:putative membrane protein
MLTFSAEDRDLITAAVTEAERKSDGEIVTIVAERSDFYHDVSMHYALLAMLIVPATGAVLPQSWYDWMAGLLLGWNEQLSFRIAMFAVLVAMALIFLIVRIALARMSLRMALTPDGTKTRRVRRRAMQLFRMAAERRTRAKTGVVLYLSLLERRAEIVADEAIHSQVEPEIWGEAMAELIGKVKEGRPAEGMALAVAKIGAVLASCLPPPSSDNPNELPDRLIEL